jgi:hypothetical protein
LTPAINLPLPVSNIGDKLMTNNVNDAGDKFAAGVYCIRHPSSMTMTMTKDISLSTP